MAKLGGRRLVGAGGGALMAVSGWGGVLGARGEARGGARLLAQKLVRRGRGAGGGAWAEGRGRQIAKGGAWLV